MVNKDIGNAYERKFVEFINKKGAWCHIFAYNKNGQPCDVIAVKDNLATFIDVKHCQGDRFPFDDIQPNQITCFEFNEQCGNDRTGFAIWFEKQNNWYWLPYQYVYAKKICGHKSVHYLELEVIE